MNLFTALKLESTIVFKLKAYDTCHDNKLVGSIASHCLFDRGWLLGISAVVSVPLESGDIDHVGQGGGGLLPVDVALAVLIDHVLEDGPEPLVATGRVPLLSESSDLVIKPGAAHVAGVAEVGVVVAVVKPLVTADLLVNPARGLADISVDSGHAVLAASDAPGDDAGLNVGVGVVLAGADKGGAAITLARVLAGNTAGAEEGVVELVLLAESGGPQLVLAHGLVHHGEADLLEDNLVLTRGPELVLAPSGGEAGGAVKDLIGVRKTDGVKMLVQDKVLRDMENSKVILEIPSIKLWVDVEVGHLSVLVGVGLSLVLGVPLSAPDLQLGGVLSELVHAVGSGEEDAGGDEGAAALVEVHSLGLAAVSGLLLHWLLVEDGAHVRPLSKLKLVLSEALDPGAETIEVPAAALGLVSDNWGWGRGNKVGVLAADIQKAGALAVLGGQGSETVPDVDEPGAVGDDGAVGALVVGHAHVAKALSVVSAVLEGSVHRNSGLGLLDKGGGVGGVVTGVLAVGLLDHLNQHVHVAVVGGEGSVAGAVAAGVDLLLTGAGAEHLLDGGVGLVSERGRGVVRVALGGSAGQARHGGKY